MEKLRGDKGKAIDMCLEKLREPDSDLMEIQKADNTETKAITTINIVNRALELQWQPKAR